MNNCVNYCKKKDFGIQGLTRLEKMNAILKEKQK